MNRGRRNMFSNRRDNDDRNGWWNRGRDDNDRNRGMFGQMRRGFRDDSNDVDDGRSMWNRGGRANTNSWNRNNMWGRRDDSNEDDGRRWGGNAWGRRDDRDDDSRRLAMFAQQRSLLAPRNINRNTGFFGNQQRQPQRQQPGVSFLGNLFRNRGTTNTNSVQPQPARQQSHQGHSHSTRAPRANPVAPVANNRWSQTRAQPTVNRNAWNQPQRQTRAPANNWAQNALMAAYAMDRFF